MEALHDDVTRFDCHPIASHTMIQTGRTRENPERQRIITREEASIATSDASFEMRDPLGMQSNSAVLLDHLMSFGTDI